MFQFKVVCPNLGKEGIINLDHSVPAGEICPLCQCLKGVGMGRCNFSMIKIGTTEVHEIHPVDGWPEDYATDITGRKGGLPETTM